MFKLFKILLNIYIFLIIHIISFNKADYNTKVTYPTLYETEHDSIIQLDGTTFNNTIFCVNRNQICTSYVVKVNIYFIKYINKIL